MSCPSPCRRQSGAAASSDEVGLLRIINSAWKIRGAKGMAPMLLLSLFSIGILLCYCAILFGLMFNVDYDKV